MDEIFSSIEEAIEEIREGRIIIVCDDEDRENEGDFVLAAERVTPEAVNFLAKNGRGLICMPCVAKRLDELKIQPMVTDNTCSNETAFAVSIGAKGKITTGISAADRAVTIQAVLDPATRPEDISRPGHVFPLRAREGGVLTRAGHTEASVDLARLAGLFPAGVICEIMNDDGTMARVPQLAEIKEKFGLKMVTVEELIRYRRRTEKLVKRVADVRLPTAYGDFRGIAYESLVDGSLSLALVKGDVSGAEDVLVRVHSECLTGDVFSSRRCDCGSQLARALETGRGGRPGRGPVHAGPRGAGHRPDPQAQGLRTAGGGPGHGGGQPRPGLPAGRARLRHRRADPLRPGPHHHAPAHQQPGQAGGPGGLRA